MGKLLLITALLFSTSCSRDRNSDAFIYQEACYFGATHAIINTRKFRRQLSYSEVDLLFKKMEIECKEQADKQ